MSSRSCTNCKRIKIWWLESLINYPLGPTQFEVEWNKLVDKCGIREHPVIDALWQKRRRWIATYFKGMYCRRMTSTQRFESQKRVLKDGYVSNVTTLYMFAKRKLDSIQHTDHMDAGESHYSQVFATSSNLCFFYCKKIMCLFWMQLLNNQWLQLLVCVIATPG